MFLFRAALGLPNVLQRAILFNGKALLCCCKYRGMGSEQVTDGRSSED